MSVTTTSEAPGEPSGKGAQTRQAILDAAIARFGRDGFRGTSVADIARDAGVGGTVTYAYFPNKEALFMAAVDADAAGVIGEGLTSILAADKSADGATLGDWRMALTFTLLEAVDHHPLAKRLLGGLEPEVTARVLEIPALSELRAACADRLRADQLAGRVRADIDPVPIANGVISLILSLLMSLVQLGPGITAEYADDVTAVFGAALDPPH
ncbi:MAG: TetR/AcrR family transcriptional regulator [Actinomycetota bacterium]|nr:TetR/AcrR family transcriptional regulator [Actinomycetota bacterium]